MAMKRATKRKILLLVVVLLAAGAVAALYGVHKVRQQQRLARDLEQGMAAYEEQRYEDALSPLSRYVGRHKDNAEVLLAFAETRANVPTENRSHLRQALAISRLALEVEPDSLEAREMFMELAAALGFLAEVGEAAASVLELDPSNVMAHQIRLEVARETGDSQEREQAARDMAAARPERFDAQLTALGELMSLELPLEDVRAFVEEAAPRFSGRPAAELLRARLTMYERDNWADSEERKEELQQLTDSQLATAAALPPSEPVEAIVLITSLDQSNLSLQGISTDELLRRYLDNEAIRADLLTFAAARAWQRSDSQLLSELRADASDAQGFPTEALAWLALGNEDSESLLEELRSRTDAEGQAWTHVVEAQRLLAANDFEAARERLHAAMSSRTGSAAEAATFLQAFSLRALGENAMADRLLESLAPGRWPRASLLRSQIALERGDAERAYVLASMSRPASDGVTLLEAAVQLEESGYRWPDNIPTGRQLADGALRNAPEEPILLSFHGRAELAAGNAARARDVADQLLALQARADGRADFILRFADRLREVDSDRAAALRAKYRTSIDQAITPILDRFGRGEIGAEELEAQIADAVEGASEEDRLRARMLYATIIDQRGLPEAADQFLAIADEHSDSAAVQITVLRSSSVWSQPNRLEPVIDRLRTLTGEEGVLWRIFAAKRLLLSDDSEAVAARVINDLSGVLRHAPNDVLALELMTEAMLRVDDLRRAATFASRAAEAAPDNLNLALRSAEVFARAGMYEEAETRVLESAGIQSNDLNARARRAQLLVRYGRGQESLADWRWLGATGVPAYSAEAAVALANLGQADEAADIVESLATASDLALGVRSRLADALAALGRRDEALDLLKGAAAEGGAAEAAIAGFLARNTDSPEDFQALEEFVESTDSPEAWAAVIRGYMGVGQLDDARRVHAKGVERGLGEELEPYARALSEDAALDPNAYFVVARASLSGIDEPWAAELASQLDSIIDGDMSLQQFIAGLRSFVQEQPQFVSGWMLLAQAQASAGDLAAARSTAQSMLQSAPGNPGAALAAAQLFRRIGMADEGLLAAREYVARLESPNLDGARLIAQFALLTGRAGEAWEAIRPWRAQLESRIDHGLYAQAALETGALTEAAEIVWNWDAEDVSWTIQAVQLAPRIDDLSARREWLSTAGERIPEDHAAGRLVLAGAWYDLALRSGDRSLLDRALALAEVQAEQPFVAARLTRLRASCHSLLGRTDQAVSEYRRAVELDPQDADSLNNLAYILLDRGQPEEAVELATRAVDIARTRGADAESLASFLDTLATAHLKAGVPAEAAAGFEEALSLQPGYDYAIVGLAEAYLALGRTDEAREVFAGLRDPSERLTERVSSLRDRLQ